jgi:5-methylthioribose kinase
MREITPENAADYLRETGRVGPGRAVEATALGWGVSNIVMRVEVAGQGPIVLKQSRIQLRTHMLWVSRLDRIWIETAALKRLTRVLPAGVVPEILWEDRENYLFAMSCLPDDAAVWKAQLLAGDVDPDVAQRAGDILGTIHADAGGPASDWGPLAETTVFDQLRLDPFYRTVAHAHPDLAPRLEALVAESLDPPERTFVHADFSPKNLLVHAPRAGRARGLSVVDFETAHAGDPAFDLGFFTSHLLLKALRASPAGHGPYLGLIERFWDAYLERTGLNRASARVRRGTTHAAACALARVDGKSPVDYLDEPRRAAVRRFASRSLTGGGGWEALAEAAAREMRG